MLTKNTLAIPALIALGTLLTACGDGSGGGGDPGNGLGGNGSGNGNGTGGSSNDMAQAGFNTSASERWSWMHPLPQNYGLWSVISDGQKFHAVGARGTYMTSPTGDNWTVRHLPVEILMDISWDGANTFVAVGKSGLNGVGGMIAYSTNGGDDWQPAEVPGTPGQFNQVVWTGNAFVAMGSGAGEVVTSPNGITWTLSNNGQTGSTVALANQGATLVSGQTPGAHYSLDGGSTWSPTSGSLSSTIPVRAFAHDDGQFIGVGGYNLGGFVTSADGITWSRDQADFDYVYQGSVFNSFTFSNVTRFGDNYWVSDTKGNLHLRDADAPNWTQPISSTFGFISSMATRNDTLLAVGTKGGLLRASAADDWSELKQTPMGEEDFTSMVHDDSGNILVGTKDGKVWLTADDGQTWTDTTVFADNAIADLAFSGYGFVAVGNGFMASSPDGVNWTVEDGFEQPDFPGFSLPFHSVAATIDGWVAIGNNNAVVCTMVTSCDFLDTNTPSLGLNSITHDGHHYIVVTVGGGIYRSVDGNTWSLMFTAGRNLATVVASAEALVASANSTNVQDAVYVSMDLGVTWQAAQFSEDADILGGLLSVSDNTFYLYSTNNYTLWTSTDGLDWVPEYAPLEVHDTVEISGGQMMRGWGNRLYKRLAEEE